MVLPLPESANSRRLYRIHWFEQYVISASFGLCWHPSSLNHELQCDKRLAAVSQRLQLSRDPRIRWWLPSELGGLCYFPGTDEPLILQRCWLQSSRHQPTLHSRRIHSPTKPLRPIILTGPCFSPSSKSAVQQEWPGGDWNPGRVWN